MVRATAELVRTKGVSATGLREVVAVAKAPRGSLQHYFPDGKDQLVAEALTWMGQVAVRRVEKVLASLDDRRPSSLLAGTVELWRSEFVSTGYGGGCPLLAAAADVAATDDELRSVIGAAFDGWLRSFSAALAHTGIPPQRAESLATVVISALEGAIVLARIHRDVAPLEAIARELGPLLDSAVASAGDAFEH